MDKPNFFKLRAEIKRDNKDAPCWDCKHFDGFYFDGVTFDCKVEGKNNHWSFVGNYCMSKED